MKAKREVIDQYKEHFVGINEELQKGLVSRISLVEDIGEMGFHRMRADKEFLRDFVISSP